MQGYEGHVLKMLFDNLLFFGTTVEHLAYYKQVSFHGLIIFAYFSGFATCLESFYAVLPFIRTHLLILSSEIDVVGNKCSFTQGFVDQGLSRSYWKVQGHSKHKKENSILKFLHIVVQYTDMKSSKTYTKCYRQYMQYIRYGPWGQLHPPETGNC
jgi:hypothetical protein